MLGNKKLGKHNKILCRLLNSGISSRGKQVSCQFSACRLARKKKPKFLRNIHENLTDLNYKQKPLAFPKTKPKHTVYKNKDDFEGKEYNNLRMSRSSVCLNGNDALGSIDSIQVLHRQTLNKRNELLFPKNDQIIGCLFNSAPTNKLNKTKNNHESEQCYCRFCLQISAIRPVHCRHYNSSTLVDEQSYKFTNTNYNNHPYHRNTIGNSNGQRNEIQINNRPNCEPNNHQQIMQNQHTKGNNYNINQPNRKTNTFVNGQSRNYGGNINDNSNIANECSDWICECHCFKKPNGSNKNYPQSWKTDYNGFNNKNQPDYNLMTNNQAHSQFSWDSKKHNTNSNTNDPEMICKSCGNPQNERYPRRRNVEADHQSTFSDNQTHYNGNNSSYCSAQQQNVDRKSKGMNGFELHCKCFTGKQNEENNNCKMCGRNKHQNVIEEDENFCKICQSKLQNGRNQQQQRRTKHFQQHDESNKFKQNREGDDCCKCCSTRQESGKNKRRESGNSCNDYSEDAKNGNHKQGSGGVHCESESGSDSSAQNMEGSYQKSPRQNREQKRRNRCSERMGRHKKSESEGNEKLQTPSQTSDSESQESIPRETNCPPENKEEKGRFLKDKKCKDKEKVRTPTRNSGSESEESLPREKKSSPRADRGRNKKSEKSNRGHGERTRAFKERFSNGERDKTSDSEVSMSSVLNILREKCRGTNNLKLKVVKIPKEQKMSDKGKPKLKVTVR